MDVKKQEAVRQEIRDAKNSGNPPLMGLAVAMEILLEEILKNQNQIIEPMISNEKTPSNK